MATERARFKTTAFESLTAHSQTVGEYTQMKNIILLILLLSVASCQKEGQNGLIGSWCECQRDGTYKEFRIWENYTITALSDFQEKDYDDGISFYNSIINDTTLIITNGINVDIINAPEILSIEIESNDLITLENQFGLSRLTRLDYEIPDIDSANLNNWRDTYLEGFLRRAQIAGCPDLRTEEEKSPPVDLGIIEDDFEEIK